jgi:phosphoribosylaminoimidazolecarboxamide formyltransferase/IMP cyclohydrolase
MRRAFLSVSDKTGIVDFAKELVKLGFEIVSTGGTSVMLQEKDVPVTPVSDVTGFPECLDGRVKTLHPNVHAGILAMRSNAAHMKQLEELNIQPIDIVAVNLYPFKQTILKPDVAFEDAIENIDIGGPSMLRAAAKNFKDVTVVVDIDDYERVLDEYREKGSISEYLRLELCRKVFEHTAAYDALIASYLCTQNSACELPDQLTLTYEKVQNLRYGENPHQRAAFYRQITPDTSCLHAAEQLHGKELSYNNINDANGAVELLREFEETTVVAVKHANPCGVCSAPTLLEAYKGAHDGDPVSIFGGIVAMNETVDEATAKEMANIFLEIIIAPDFSEEALEILTQKKNLRLLKLPAMMKKRDSTLTKDLKRVAGGLLFQDGDMQLLNGEPTIMTKRAPSDQEMEDMLFAWKVVKHVKSNAIVIAKGKRTLGICPGQTNRIWAAEEAIKRSKKEAQGAVMASDAFFPFNDCVMAAAKAGVSAVIQPGGSIRDDDSVQACDTAGMAMVFTNMRHFKH